MRCEVCGIYAVDGDSIKAVHIADPDLPIVTGNFPGMGSSGLIRCAPIPQVRAQSSPALPPDLPPRLHQWALSLLRQAQQNSFEISLRYRAGQYLCCASSPHRIGLVSGSCSSARGFCIVFFQRCDHSQLLDFCWYFVIHFHDFWFSYRGLEPH